MVIMSDLVSILSVITSAVILMGLRTQSQQQQRQLSVLWLSRFARNSLHIQIARSRTFRISKVPLTAKGVLPVVCMTCWNLLSTCLHWKIVQPLRQRRCCCRREIFDSFVGVGLSVSIIAFGVVEEGESKTDSALGAHAGQPNGCSSLQSPSLPSHYP